MDKTKRVIHCDWFSSTGSRLMYYQLDRNNSVLDYYSYPKIGDYVTVNQMYCGKMVSGKIFDVDGLKCYIELIEMKQNICIPISMLNKSELFSIIIKRLREINV